MKEFIAVLVLIFSFQSWTKADDIREFQIEGLSLGDSLLDYYSEEEIKNKSDPSIATFYENKFIAIWFDSFSLENYDDLAVTYKIKDNKYKIHEIKGTLDFHNNIKKCIKKRDKIIKEISSLFKNAKKDDPGKRNYGPDPSGKSKTYSVYFYTKDEGYIEVSCYDVTNELYKKNGWRDALVVNIGSKEFRNFLFQHYK